MTDTTTTNPITDTAEDPDPLTPDQHARVEALRIAREVTVKRATGLTGGTNPGTAGDLIVIAQYILDGNVLDGTDAPAATDEATP